MEKLNTIQKRNKLNEVYAEGEKGHGGAYHAYGISYDSNNGYISNHGIQFQNGPRLISGSENGILDVDLLEIVRHRLKCFQAGDYKTRENEMALVKVEEALLWLNKRTDDRAERGVLGTAKY